MRFQTLLSPRANQNLMPFRRRIKRQTMGKDAIKKSSTAIIVFGQGSTVSRHTVIVANTGTRDLSGATQTIRAEQDTDKTCNIGDIIKYLNICMAISPRADAGMEDDNNGWLEYAIIKHKEVRQGITSTQLGLHSLMDVCTKAFRGDCLWTGCLPVGQQQPNSLDLKIKLPKVFTKIQLGSELEILYHFRSANSADVRTNSHKLVSTVQYKCYV